MDINESIYKAIRQFIEDKVEWVDLGLPSGTLWAKEPITDIGITARGGRRYLSDFLPSYKEIQELKLQIENKNLNCKCDENWNVQAIESLNGEKISTPIDGWFVSKSKHIKDNSSPADDKENEPSDILLFCLSGEYECFGNDVYDFLPFIPCKPGPRK